MKGYIAVITTIVLTLICLTIVVSLSLSASLSRVGNRDFIFKETSYSLASSCLDYARLQLVYDINYGGNETIVVGNGQCSILPVTASSTQKIIRTTSQVNNITTNLKLVVNDQTLQTISLEEVSSF